MIEKAIAASVEPLVDALIATEKKQAALEARLNEIQLKEGPAGRDGADGKDGVSLKGVSQDGAEIIFELSDGQELSVELPVGEKGDTGEQGPAGEPGKDADPVEVAKQAILLEEFNVVTTEAIKAMLAVRLQEEHDEVDAILN
jgi:hypothetical protein